MNKFLIALVVGLLVVAIFLFVLGYINAPEMTSELSSTQTKILSIIKN